MRFISFFRISLLVVGFSMVTALMTGCEEKHVSMLPAFAGFRLEPSQWTAGDSVVITAVQSRTGDLLYKAVYEWRVTCGDTTFSRTLPVVYDLDKSDPSFGFRIPEDVSGYTSISFSATYQYSSATISSDIPGSVTATGGLVGSFSAMVGGMIEASCSGSATTVIAPLPSSEEQ